MIGMMYLYPPPRSSTTVTCIVPAMAAPFTAPTAAPADNDMQVKTFKMLQEILLHVNPSHSAVDNNAQVPTVPLAAIQPPASA
jgi:hypothetical protein